MNTLQNLLKNPLTHAILRHAMTFVGGLLAAGLIKDFNITPERVQQAGGAVMTLAGIAWSIVQKIQANEALAAANAAKLAAQTSSAQLAAAVK